jgi:hypothetical protein
MFNQQLQARQQFEQVRQRGLPPGAHPESPQGQQQTGMGQYL